MEKGALNDVFEVHDLYNIYGDGQRDESAGNLVIIHLNWDCGLRCMGDKLLCLLYYE